MKCWRRFPGEIWCAEYRRALSMLAGKRRGHSTVTCTGRQTEVAKVYSLDRGLTVTGHDVSMGYTASTALAFLDAVYHVRRRPGFKFRISLRGAAHECVKVTHGPARLGTSGRWKTWGGVLRSRTLDGLFVFSQLANCWTCKITKFPKLASSESTHTNDSRVPT